MKQMKRFMGLSAAALAVLLVMPASAHANLVVNPGFETGNFTGWTVMTNGDGFTGVECGTGNQHSGNCNAFLGQIGSEATLSQTLATVAGETYMLDYWLRNDGGPVNSFSAWWNNVLVAGSAINNAGPFGYTHYIFTVLATGPSSILRFNARQDPSFFRFDDINVESAGAVIPEPTSLVLLGTGLIGLARARRRRAAAKV